MLERRQLLAAVPTLVKDINTQAETATTPLNLFSNGTTSYFTQLDVNAGYELWKTDGTTAGTVMVKDINPGPASSRPTGFAQLGSAIYFSATTASAGTELWKTDGTAAGTVMVADIVPGAASSNPTYFTVAGSKLFFFAQTPSAGNELWTSDGAVAGTSMVADMNPGTSGQNLRQAQTGTLGNTFLWLGQTGSSYGLLRSDGTTAGTYLVSTGSGFYPDAIFSAPGRAIISSTRNGLPNAPLYVTDGTPSGTTTFATLADPLSFKVAGSNVYYSTYDSTNGYRLFRKAVAGTTATQITLPAGMQKPVNLLPFGGSLLFSAFTNGDNRTALYHVPATGSAATLITSISAAENELYSPALLGSTLFFINGTSKELWKSDGTPAGTGAVAALTGLAPYDISYNPVMMVSVGSRVVLMNRTAATGSELWTSTGTPESFALLKDINAGTENSDAAVTGRIGNVLFYSANDGVNGAELWRTDGTAAGTYLVKDINPGPANGGAGHGVTLGNRLLFSAYNPANNSDLWITDGTTAGTTLISIPGGEKIALDTVPVVLDGVAYFNAQTSAAGYELWRSDGTAAGTYLLKDIATGTTNSYPMALTVLNGRLYFTASTLAAGRELWTSDGTAAGTVLVKDVYAGASGGAGSAATLAVADGKLFFAGTDSASGTELWTSDGTAVGTVRVTDLNPGSANASPGVQYAGAGEFAQLGDFLYFNAVTPATGNELFRLNLKTMQTSLAADLVPGTGSSAPTGFKTFAGVLTFQTASTTAYQFYSFDENAGAVKRLSFPTGGGGGGERSMIANGALFFKATGPSGSELYEWDGGSSDVQLIDVDPNSSGSYPTGFQAIPDGLVFAANTRLYGDELMTIADTAAPRAWATTFDFNTGPRVRVDWTENVLATANTATLISLKTNQPVPGVSLIRTIRADGSGVDYSFSSTLPDGNYRLQFNSADFRDAAGNVGVGTQSLDFFVLAGDVNRDRAVNFADLVILAQNYGKSGRTFSEGNIDYSADGVVSFADLVLLAQRYNTQVAPAAVASVAASGKKKPVAGDVLA